MKAKYLEGIFSAALVITSLLIFGYVLSMIFSPKASAVDNQTYETDFTPMTFARSTTSVTGSTNSVTGILTDYTIYIATPNVTGGIGGAYTISYTTNTNRAGTASVVTSSTVFIPANVFWNQKLWIGAYNPTIIFGNLSAAATAYLQINYGQVRTGQ